MSITFEPGHEGPPVLCLMRNAKHSRADLTAKTTKPTGVTDLSGRRVPLDGGRWLFPTRVLCHPLVISSTLPIHFRRRRFMATSSGGGGSGARSFGGRRPQCDPIGKLSSTPTPNPDGLTSRKQGYSPGSPTGTINFGLKPPLPFSPSLPQTGTKSLSRGCQSVPGGRDL